MKLRNISVATVVIAVIVVAVTLAMAALGAVAYRADRDREWSDLRARTDRMADQLSVGLALPLWNFDRPQIEKVLDSAMTSADVDRVVVRQDDVSSPSGVTVYGRERDARWQPVEWRPPAAAPPPADLVVAERAIAAADASDVPLGSVRVLATPRFVEESLGAAREALLLRIVLLDLLLIVGLFALLWWIVLEPLRVVEQYALAASSGATIATIEAGAAGTGGRRFLGELEGLRSSLAKTIGLLDARYAALVTSENRLEQRVRERTTELETANHELEAFSYTVSHDLRAPLRAIVGFSRIVVEEHAALLPPEATRLLRIIDENTRQMGRLIDDLLAFSRLGRQPLVKSRVLPGPMVAALVEQVRAGEPPGRRVDVAIGELPPCEADPALLAQVFMNLIANAFKYSRNRATAHVRIGARTGDTADGTAGDRAGEPVYFVADDGAGFDMRYADRLFGVFQRLHPASEYEGTGVGLAIVQRIVHRHGGRVWAEAAPDRGATFFFTLGGGRDGGP